jgi:hypothetical protein
MPYAPSGSKRRKRRRRRKKNKKTEKTAYKNNTVCKSTKGKCDPVLN